MGNICCRRVVGYSPTEQGQGRCAPPHPLEPSAAPQKGAYQNGGDDCAINELLEGRMDLDVMLPDGRKVRLTVERRTPVMDLLVQAASSTKISPAGHTIHVLGEGGNLHYKPSTPIGSLDANTICIVPKKDEGRRVVKGRPFEPTFRVQVHLPRHQLTVARVSPRMRISELRVLVCEEKGLETTRYQLVRPSDLGQPLPGDMTLADYGATELTLLSNACIESHLCNSTSHIMPYSKRTDDVKKKTGILRLLAEDSNRTKPKVQSSHLMKTDCAPVHQGRYKPKKRRPAPPPPPPIPEPSTFHSRQSSSDSSGYHDAGSSCLHEEPLCLEKASSDSSGVSSLDAKVVSSGAVKKRKAPPPPLVGGKESIQPLVDKDEPLEKTEPSDTEEQEDREEPVVKEEAVNKEEPVDNESIDSANKTNELPNPDSLESIESRLSPDDKKEDSDDAVTKVAQSALNARIEQDVTQQEIVSGIHAAFQSVDPKPSLLSIKQRKSEQRKILPEITAWCSSREKTPSKEIYELRKNSELTATRRNELLAETPAAEEKVVHPDLLKSVDELPDDCLDTVVPPPNGFRSTDEDAEKQKETPISNGHKTLRRSSSLLSLEDSTSITTTRFKTSKTLQRSLSDLKKFDERNEFEVEQERLQKEYLKLERQFLRWQQQLLSNHAMLREECIVPQYARTLRQSHSLPEGEDYSDASPPASCPRVSRSLSYEPTRCSTLPRSTINIPPLEFGTLSINNGTLRSSKTKSYFKPPQARVSTKNRQRLPPEIKKDGELDIYDDNKILSTILPTFEALRKISENEDSSVVTSSPTEGTKKVPPPVPSKQSKLSTDTTRKVEPAHIEPKRANISTVSSSELSQNAIPPPPLPPVTNGTLLKVPPTIKEKRVNTPQVDPRDQLMQEIRKFGGKTSLRKISLSS